MTLKFVFCFFEYSISQLQGNSIFRILGAVF